MLDVSVEHLKKLSTEKEKVKDGNNNNVKSSFMSMWSPRQNN